MTLRHAFGLLPLTIVLACSLVGCGGTAETVIQSEELTEEQQAQVQAEDDLVQDEESGE